MPQISKDEVYRRFGEVAELAQSIERSLACVVVLQRLLERHPGLAFPDDPEQLAPVVRGDFTEFRQALSNNTMGQVVGHLRSANSPSPESLASLRKGVGVRNYLMHAFFEDHLENLLTPDGRATSLAVLEVGAVILREAEEVATRLLVLYFKAVAISETAGRVNDCETVAGRI